MTALRFDGEGFEYFKIWIVNILLIIVTLGLYYPWAKVRNNRYFYANTNLEGKNFEYHATGKQLFVGYLISMALLIVYIVVQEVSPIGSFVVLGIFLLALPWIVWRSLIFNMRVTSFSNVRFGFDGTLGNAYLNYLLLPILGMLVVYGLPIGTIALLAHFGFDGGGLVAGLTVIGGLIVFALAITLFAFIKKRNVQYMLNGSRYGQGRFSTDVATAPFAFITLKTFGLSLLAFLLLGIVLSIISLIMGLASSLGSLGQHAADPEAIAGAFQDPVMLIVIGLAYASFIFIATALFAYSQARQRAYIYANTELDEKIRFKSTLGARRFAWVSVSNLLLIIFTLGLGTAWAKVRMARAMVENTRVDTSFGFDEYVTSQQNEQSSLGEQIGDAFDVDVGIGL